MYEEQVNHREKEQFWTEVAEFMQMRDSNKTGQWAGKHYYNSFLNAYSDVKLSKEDKAWIQNFVNKFYKKGNKTACVHACIDRFCTAKPRRPLPATKSYVYQSIERVEKQRSLEAEQKNRTHPNEEKVGQEPEVPDNKLDDKNINESGTNESCRLNFIVFDHVWK